MKFTSDLHFGHDKEFLYLPRGFETIEEHDAAVIERWNGVVGEDEDVYVLGDLMLNDNEHGVECLRQLKGRIHYLTGNHDTDARMDLYDQEGLDYEGYATFLKYRDYRFYLSHYPTITASGEKEKLKQCTINLFGHTHQNFNFYNDWPFMYHVGCDSHKCTPVDVEEIIADCDKKMREVKGLA